MSDQRQDGALPDAEYIARAKAGEVEAFGHLYRRYLTPIYRYVRLRVSTDRDAEDLTEMVFLRSFEALEKYEERGAPFAAYLYRVARNAIIDHYRSPDRSESLDDLEWLEEGSPHIESALIERERAREIKKAMAKLPETYREVIRLRVVMELPTEQVASWLDVKPAYARVLLHRALNALRRELEGVDEPA